VSADELRFDRQKWTQKLGPLCQLWANLYKREAFEGLQVTQEHLNRPDPVEAFVYMEVVAVTSVLRRVDDSVKTISKVLEG